MIERNDIRHCFPELHWIKDKDLQEKIISAWELAVDRGNWKRLEDIPFTLLIDDPGPLIDHTKRIVNLVRNVGKLRREKLNMDYLVAGALLHDVGKPLEYELRDGKVVTSDLGAKMRHPASGARLAAECGLPKEVVHIIAAHSHEGDTMNRIPEAIIVTDVVDKRG